MELKPFLQDHEFTNETHIRSESYVSKDIMKSATVENLISQNEDLMERMKMFTRRLASLEDLNQELQTENFNQKNQILNFQDQVQVLKEKDQAWKNKVDEMEDEKEVLTAKIRQLEPLISEVERFKKYHDKIRIQVKPYITALKNSRDEAQIKLDGLQRQMGLKDSQLQDVRVQMQELLKHTKNQIEEVQKQRLDVIELTEKQKQLLSDENRSLKLEVRMSQDQIKKMSSTLENQAELENRVIELERSKVDMKSRLETEILRLQEKLNASTGAQTRLEIENQDLKDYVNSEHESRMKYDQEIMQLKRQLESMRFMWNQKNEESERLTQSLNALEKLNLSLSQKLQEIRESEKHSS